MDLLALWNDNMSIEPVYDRDRRVGNMRDQILFLTFDRLREIGDHMCVGWHRYWVETKATERGFPSAIERLRELGDEMHEEYLNHWMEEDQAQRMNNENRAIEPTHDQMLEDEDFQHAR